MLNSDVALKYVPPNSILILNLYSRPMMTRWYSDGFLINACSKNYMGRVIPNI